MKRPLIQIFLIGLFVYLLSWSLVYKADINTLAIQSEDTVPTLLLPFQILKHGNLYLDDYYGFMLDKYPQPDDKDHAKGLLPFYLVKSGEHYLSAFPIITSIISLPVYIVPVLLDVPVTWDLLILIGHLTAAIIVSLSGSFMYVLLGKFELETKWKYVLVFIYLFGTVNYAMLSQSLWQHGTLELFIIAALIFFKRYLDTQKPKDLYFLNLFLGIAFLARPTAALVIVSLNAFIVLREFRRVNFDFKKIFIIIAGLFLPALFFLWYNSKFYLGIENQGYASQLGNSWLGDFPISFLGVWLSPSKGIHVYSPVFLFSLLGFYLSLKNKSKETHVFLLFGVVVLLHTLIISFWKHWYGGWSFGYRMSSDVIPFLILLLIPFIKSDLFNKYSRLFYLSVGVSVMVQLYGMVFFDGIWHAAYDKGFSDTSWLWSVENSELAFNIRRVMVKLGFLSKACETCSSVN